MVPSAPETPKSPLHPFIFLVILPSKDVTFKHVSVVDGEGSPVTRRVFLFFPSEYGTVVLALRRLVSPERRATDMLTFAEFIAVLSLVIAAFGLGYRLGRDKRNDTKNKQE